MTIEAAGEEEVDEEEGIDADAAVDEEDEEVRR